MIWQRLLCFIVSFNLITSGNLPADATTSTSQLTILLLLFYIPWITVSDCFFGVTLSYVISVSVKCSRRFLNSWHSLLQAVRDYLLTLTNFLHCLRWCRPAELMKHTGMGMRHKSSRLRCWLYLPRRHVNNNNNTSIVFRVLICWAIVTAA